MFAPSVTDRAGFCVPRVPFVTLPHGSRRTNRVYTDKIRIWNPGQLPADWNVGRLLGQHASYPFNPDIANAFFRAGMIESWGRGIEKILESCAVAQVPPPKIQCEQGDLWIEFPFAPLEKEGGAMGGSIDGPKSGPS